MMDKQENDDQNKENKGVKALVCKPTESDDNQNKESKGSCQMQLAAVPFNPRPSFTLPNQPISDVEKMRENLKIIEENLDFFSGAPSNNLVDHVAHAIIKILYLVEDVDNANDFFKIGGFNVLPRLLNINVLIIVYKTEELIGVITQNNKFSQEKILGLGLLEQLFHLMTSSKFEEPIVKQKALFAISCLCGNNDEAFFQFFELGGTLSLFEFLESKNIKLKNKAAFFLQSLVGCQPTLRDFIFDLGYVSKLVSLVDSTTDESEEFLLHMLLLQVINHPESKNYCSGLPSLQVILRKKLDRYNNDNKYLECIDHTCDLLNYLFPN